MYDREESMKTFALVLYNLLTPTVYSYDKAFLDQVAAFAVKADFPEQYADLLGKMLQCAYAEADSEGEASK